MNMRMILVWAVLQIPITGYCSEWIYVTRDTMGTNFLLIEPVLSKTNIKFFSGLRNYASPEKRFGSFSSVGKFKLIVKPGGYGYINLIICRENGKRRSYQFFSDSDREWFNPRQGIVEAAALI